jgi:hypothetical protein
VKEVGILIGMAAAFFALGAIKPADDGDERTKNFYKTAWRVLDKMQNEITFYYNPTNIEQVLQGSLFPSIGLFTDAYHFVNSAMWVEMFGDEEQLKRNHPSKHFFKLFPVTRTYLTYVGLLDPDIAKELDISIPTEVQMR